MTSFSRFVDKRAIYRLGIISLAHAQVLLISEHGYAPVQNTFSLLVYFQRGLIFDLVD